MKKKFVILIFFNFLILIMNVDSKEITLQEGLQILFKNNLQLKILESKLIQARYKKLEAFSGWLPKAQIQLNYTKLSEPQIKIPPQMSMFFGSVFPTTLTSDKLYTGNFTVSQLLFSSGKVFSAYKISCFNYELIKNEYEKTKQELETQYKEAFLKSLLAKKVLEVSKKAVEISSENYKVSTQLYNEGRVSYLDYSSAKVNYLNSEINLLKMKSNFEVAKEALKNLLCVDFEVEPLGDIEEFYKEYKFDLEELKSNIPKIYDVKILDYQKKILDYNLHIVRTEAFPIVSLVGNYSWTSDKYDRPIKEWEDKHSWSVVLSWPIFSGGSVLSKYKQAKENIAQINYSKEALINALQMQLISLYSNYIQYKESLKLAKQNLELSEENYNIAKIYYLEGRTSYLEFLQAEINMSNVKINYYQTLTDYIITCEKLKKFIIE